MGIQCSCCDRDKDSDRDKTLNWLVPATESESRTPEKDTEKITAAEASTLEEPSTVTITVKPPAKETNDSGAAVLKDLQDKLAVLFGTFVKEEKIQQVKEKKRMQRSKTFATAPDGSLASPSYGRRKTSSISVSALDSSASTSASHDSTPTSKRSSQCDSEDTVKLKARRRHTVVPEVEQILEIQDDHFTSSGGRKRRGDRRRRS